MYMGAVGKGWVIVSLQYVCLQGWARFPRILIHVCFWLEWATMKNLLCEIWSVEVKQQTFV